MLLITPRCIRAKRIAPPNTRANPRRHEWRHQRQASQYMAADCVPGHECQRPAKSQQVPQLPNLDGAGLSPSRQHHHHQTARDDRSPDGDQQAGAFLKDQEADGKGHQRLKRDHGNSAGCPHHPKGCIVQYPGYAVSQDAHHGNPAVGFQGKRLDVVEVDRERNARNQNRAHQHRVEGGHRRGHGAVCRCA